ncbi:hypothetical protein KY289_008095 [Solanum tuberosum]|nr:hypothetical protein KY289_008095 [Solanum tuberosum]
MITTEMPEMKVDPDGYNAVKNYMIHGPCGDLNPGCPCMKQGKCNKHFPKKFNNQTTFDPDGFPIYRRRNTGKRWTRRKRGNSIGRIYFAHPASGERFYMRMLLNFVNGSTSFESIRTINGVRYDTYKEACYALGLLEDDKEWNDCLAEAACWASVNELRNLFVTILIHCQVSDSSKLWRSNYEILSEDITSLQRKRFQLEDLQLTEKQLESYTLFEIETILMKMGKSLKDIHGMPLPDSTLMNDTGKRLINEELEYDKGEGRTYFSADNVCKASVNTNDEDLLYPTEFLNNLRFSGIPNHDKHLKVGTPVMLLRRNLNQSEGLCNGTRLIVTHLGTSFDGAENTVAIASGISLINVAAGSSILLRREVEAIYPAVVSCADIFVFAARDAIVLLGGPYWNVPKGRKDRRISRASETTLLPKPTFNISQLQQSFNQRGLSLDDLVALLGAHTLGFTYFLSFMNCIYNFNATHDIHPTLRPSFAASLKGICMSSPPPPPLHLLLLLRVRV